MWLTEKEASTKWCPMAKVGHSINRLTGEMNSMGVIPNGTNCIGSRCMMWESDTIRTPDGEFRTVGRCGLSQQGK